jgi:acetolactate synthase-1/2/3 large subunit
MASKRSEKQKPTVFSGTDLLNVPQEIIKYGRGSGVELGPYDPVLYAKAFGATGLMIRNADDIVPALKKAFNTPGPVLVGVHVDYRDNYKLFEMVDETAID